MNDTVAAISTPRGKGGVAMVRVSGSDTFEIVSRVFAPASSGKFAEREPNTAYYGSFLDEKGVFDDGICLLFKAPRSFTGEDVAELYCHGGTLVTQKLLTAVFSAGASPAGAGEFTKRAFINGKITLTQAEAIGGIIDAESEKYLGVSARQASGSLSKELGDIAKELKHLTASVYAYIDYPDEDMTDVSVAEMKTTLNKAKQKLKKLAESHSYGKAIGEGIMTAIVGKPNVGKSSLLNMLCGEERAIVTDIAGTTRDVITETVRLGDYVLRLSDTAGIRESLDTVEKLGVERSMEAISNAELVLAVFDCSKPLDTNDEGLISAIKSAGKAKNAICVLNKSDISAPVFHPPFEQFAEISAYKREGIEEIETLIARMVGADNVGEGDEIVTNARQYASISKALASVTDALDALDGYTQDVAGMDIERALESLYEADGRAVGEEIVSEIFSHFCVGK